MSSPFIPYIPPLSCYSSACSPYCPRCKHRYTPWFVPSDPLGHLIVFHHCVYGYSHGLSPLYLQVHPIAYPHTGTPQTHPHCTPKNTLYSMSPLYSQVHPIYSTSLLPVLPGTPAAWSHCTHRYTPYIAHPYCQYSQVPPQHGPTVLTGTPHI